MDKGLCILRNRKINVRNDKNISALAEQFRYCYQTLINDKHFTTSLIAQINQNRQIENTMFSVNIIT